MPSAEGLRRYINSIPDSRVALQIINVLNRVLPNDVINDTAITAKAGGGQTSATPLNTRTSFHAVTTVATAADSVLLPTPKVGDVHVVKNSGSNSMQVFADGSGTIDSVATTTGIAHPAGEAMIYWCQVGGNYLTLGGAAANQLFASITGSAATFPIAGLAAAQGGSVTLTGGASSTSGNAGGAAALLGGAAGATGVGGAATLTGAAGGATSGTGGAVVNTGGAGTAGNATGGAVSNIGGAGQGSAAGGASVLTGGAGGLTGAGGAITLTSGAGGATSGAAGAINITVGSATSGNGSAITLTAGNGAAGTSSGGNVNLVAGTAVSTGVPGEVQVNGDSSLMTINVALTATDATRTVFVATRACRLKAVKEVHSTASTSGTLQLEKCTGTTAPGSGSSLLTGTMTLAGTANTVVSGTLVATVATITLAAGDRISIVIAGTMTNLVGGLATITLAPA